MLRFRAVSDTAKKGGGGKKSATEAKKRRPSKPKSDSFEDWVKNLPF